VVEPSMTIPSTWVAVAVRLGNDTFVVVVVE
jgi:hypothetical protein